MPHIRRNQCVPIHARQSPEGVWLAGVNCELETTKIVFISYAMLKTSFTGVIIMIKMLDYEIITLIVHIENGIAAYWRLRS